MPAGDHERSHRVKRRIIEFILFGIDEHPVHVGEKMVDPDQRLPIGGNKPLGEIQPHQQCGDKPGACVTAIASISSKETPAVVIASLQTFSIAVRCSRAASSGTTPP